MPKTTPDRPGFRTWIGEQPEGELADLPLTHTTKCLVGEDIIRSDVIYPSDDKTLGRICSFFFYGRPAYRSSKDNCIKLEAACPICFIFKPALLSRASDIHAFDTGAFANRLYSHVLIDEFNVGDFSIGKNRTEAKKLIMKVFKTNERYFDGDLKSASIDMAKPFEFQATAYLNLILSPGRNEPDDRISTIEVTIDGEVQVAENLLAICAPHTLWTSGEGAPWLMKLHDASVDILTYEFIPGRPPEFYHAQMSASVKRFYKEKGFL